MFRSSKPYELPHLGPGQFVTKLLPITQHLHRDSAGSLQTAQTYLLLYMIHACRLNIDSSHADFIQLFLLPTMYPTYMGIGVDRCQQQLTLMDDITYNRQLYSLGRHEAFRLAHGISHAVKTSYINLGALITLIKSCGRHMGFSAEQLAELEDERLITLFRRAVSVHDLGQTDELHHCLEYEERSATYCFAILSATGATPKEAARFAEIILNKDFDIHNRVMPNTPYFKIVFQRNEIGFTHTQQEDEIPSKCVFRCILQAVDALTFSEVHAATISFDHTRVAMWHLLENADITIKRNFIIILYALAMENKLLAEKQGDGAFWQRQIHLKHSIEFAKNGCLARMRQDVTPEDCPIIHASLGTQALAIEKLATIGLRSFAKYSDFVKRFHPILQHSPNHILHHNLSFRLLYGISETRGLYMLALDLFNALDVLHGYSRPEKLIHRSIDTINRTRKHLYKELATLIKIFWDNWNNRVALHEQPYSDPRKSYRINARPCKRGILAVIDAGGKICFCLDDWIPERAALKQIFMTYTFKKDETLQYWELKNHLAFSHTDCEIRFLFRASRFEPHILQSVKFYYNGEETIAPWLQDSPLYVPEWEQYKPKSFEEFASRIALIESKRFPLYMDSRRKIEQTLEYSLDAIDADDRLEQYETKLITSFQAYIEALTTNEAGLSDIFSLQYRIRNNYFNRRDRDDLKHGIDNLVNAVEILERLVGPVQPSNTTTGYIQRKVIKICEEQKLLAESEGNYHIITAEMVVLIKRNLLKQAANLDAEDVRRLYRARRSDLSAINTIKIIDAAYEDDLPTKDFAVFYMTLKTLRHPCFVLDAFYGHVKSNPTLNARLIHLFKQIIRSKTNLVQQRVHTANTYLHRITTFIKIFVDNMTLGPGCDYQNYYPRFFRTGDDGPAEMTYLQQPNEKHYKNKYQLGFLVTLLILVNRLETIDFNDPNKCMLEFRRFFASYETNTFKSNKTNTLDVTAPNLPLPLEQMILLTRIAAVSHPDTYKMINQILSRRYFIEFSRAQESSASISETVLILKKTAHGRILAFNVIERYIRHIYTQFVDADFVESNFLPWLRQLLHMLAQHPDLHILNITKQKLFIKDINRCLDRQIDDAIYQAQGDPHADLSNLSQTLLCVREITSLLQSAPIYFRSLNQEAEELYQLSAKIKAQSDQSWREIMRPQLNKRIQAYKKTIDVIEEHGIGVPLHLKDILQQPLPGQQEDTTNHM